MPVTHVNGTDIAYELNGSGPLLVLAAGTGYPGATWPPAFLRRVCRSHSVLTFDYRGVGGTPDTGGLFSTRMFAADALALAAQLSPGPVDILGHSMGGRVAQWMALDSPSAVRSLVLAATGPGQVPGLPPPERGLPLRTAVRMIESGYEGFIREYQRMTFFDPEFARAQPAAVEWLARTWWEHRPSTEAYLKHVIARQRHDTAALLHRITQPCLVLVGGADTTWMGTGSHLEQSRYLATALPNAELRVLEGLKHGLFWQAPERSADAVLEWLGRVGAPPITRPGGARDAAGP